MHNRTEEEAQLNFETEGDGRMQRITVPLDCETEDLLRRAVKQAVGAIVKKQDAKNVTKGQIGTEVGPSGRNKQRDHVQDHNDQIRTAAGWKTSLKPIEWDTADETESGKGKEGAAGAARDPDRC